MSRLCAVVFDVDGTLVDSERHGHRVAFNEAFARADLNHVWDPELYGRLLSVAGGRQRLRAYLESQGYDPDHADGLSRDLHESKTEIFQVMVTDGAIPLRPGARRLVDELAATGTRLVVATTGNRDWVEPLLEHHFAPSTFETVITGSDVSRLKPHPEAYLVALRRSGLAASGVVAVEDSGNGLAAARAAGLSCLVVANDYTVQEDVRSAEMVVTGFGPPSHRVAGRDAPLRDDAVTPATLAALLS